MSCSLVLFTKIPNKSSCKTRLAETTGLDKEIVNKLALAFLKDVISEASKIEGKKTIFSEPGISKDEFEEITGLDLSNWQVEPQLSSNFAERLEDACYKTYQENNSGVIIIGSDSPTLNAKYINHASEKIAEGSFVLGPSSSGGIYLIGIPKAALEQGFSIKSVFQEIKSTELERFAEKISEHNFNLELLPFNFDVDVENDLITLIALLKADQKNKSFTKKELEKLELSVEKNLANNRNLKIICSSHAII